MRFGILLAVLVLGTLYIAISQGLSEKEILMPASSTSTTSTSTVKKVGFWDGFKDFIAIKPMTVPEGPKPKKIKVDSAAKPAAVKSAPPKNSGVSAVAGSSAGQEGQKVKPVPPSGFEQDELSPFYQKVKISAFNPTRSDTRGSFTLFAAFPPSDGFLDITGWRVQGNKNDYVIIPGEAVHDFDLTYYTKGGVIMYSNDSVYVYGARNYQTPNVRLNKCVGYLNGVYSLNPSFPNSCPREDFNRREIARFSGQCQSFLLSFGGCREPSTREWGALWSDAACVDFLKSRIGYRNCYVRHRNDRDFLSNAWYVWLNLPGEMPFDRQHDHILLLDKNGLLVNEYIY